MINTASVSVIKKNNDFRERHLVLKDFLFLLINTFKNVIAQKPSGTKRVQSPRNTASVSVIKRNTASLNVIRKRTMVAQKDIPF